MKTSKNVLSKMFQNSSQIYVNNLKVSLATKCVSMHFCLNIKLGCGLKVSQRKHESLCTLNSIYPKKMVP